MKNELLYKTDSISVQCILHKCKNASIDIVHALEEINAPIIVLNDTYYLNANQEETKDWLDAADTLCTYKANLIQDGKK